LLPRGTNMTYLIAAVVFAILLAVVFEYLPDGPTPEEDALALNDRLRAEVDKIDIEWAAMADADLAAVLARIRGGDLKAELSNWQPHVLARSPVEEQRPAVNLYSIVEFRNKRRWESVHIAQDLVEAERERHLAPIREKEKLELEAKYREEARQSQALYEERRKLEVEREAARSQPWADECAVHDADAAALAALRTKLSAPIPLHGFGAGIVLGTKTSDGSNLTVSVKAMQHMLVGGTTGSGKSVFIHQIVHQLLRSNEVERVLLIDLKGGVEFYRYRDDPRVRIVWEFEEVAKLVASLVVEMDERQAVMRERGLQNWPGQRTFVVIDEYAEIQSDIDAAVTRDEKENARRLAANLVRISRRARALGIVLICALQKPTVDAMDSSLRTNLNCRICLRVSSRQQAAAVLDDLDEAPVNPMALKTGRFIYFDASRGIRVHAQTQIAPGVVLADQK
jgi:S-DNA-T family DNA segregation ATPase FtsK/SpoIIIE